jgi:hypothetical protein
LLMEREVLGLSGPGEWVTVAGQRRASAFCSRTGAVCTCRCRNDVGGSCQPHINRSRLHKQVFRHPDAACRPAWLSGVWAAHYDSGLRSCIFALVVRFSMRFGGRFSARHCKCGESLWAANFERRIGPEPHCRLQTDMASIPPSHVAITCRASMRKINV